MAYPISRHEVLTAYLGHLGIPAGEVETGGGATRVVALLPNGYRVDVRADGGTWCAAVVNADGGAEWVGSVPTTEVLLEFVYRAAQRLASSQKGAAAPTA